MQQQTIMWDWEFFDILVEGCYAITCVSVNSSTQTHQCYGEDAHHVRVDCCATMGPSMSQFAATHNHRKFKMVDFMVRSQCATKVFLQSAARTQGARRHIEFREFPLCNQVHSNLQRHITHALLRQVLMWWLKITAHGRARPSTATHGCVRT